MESAVVQFSPPTATSDRRGSQATEWTDSPRLAASRDARYGHGFVFGLTFPCESVARLYLLPLCIPVISADFTLPGPSTAESPTHDESGKWVALTSMNR